MPLYHLAVEYSSTCCESFKPYPVFHFFWKAFVPSKVWRSLCKVQQRILSLSFFLSFFPSLFPSFFLAFFLLCLKVLSWYLDVYCFCPCRWRYFIFTAPFIPIPRVTSIHSFLPYCRLQHSALLHVFPNGQRRNAFHSAFITTS
jgi:hypothetical protein